MTTKMKKVWFVDGKIIEQEIPESDIYKQEPVAWISENAGLYHGKPDESLNPLPLYLAPPPCPMCEALARTVMLDQTSHDARRNPLRDHEIAKILDRERMKWHKSPPTYEFDLAFARAIEAAHGIKETKE